MNYKEPLNQIFFGPDGAGKTYLAIKKTLEIIYNCSEYDVISKIDEDDGIIHSASSPRNLEENKIKKAFDHYRDIGQIDFIVFHKNYEYSDFLHNGNNDPNCTRTKDYSEKSFFRKLVERATSNFISSQVEKVKYDFETIFQNTIFQKNVKDSPIEIDDENCHITINDLDEHYIYVYDKRAELSKILFINNLRMAFELESKIIASENGGRYYTSLLQYMTNNHKHYSEENSYKNFVLIIQDIDQCDISRVLGEVSFLIDSSKRIGSSGEIKIPLLIDNDRNDLFGIPKNLYIIGLINSHNCSNTTMSEFLRKKFVFHNILPNHQLLESIIITDKGKQTEIRLDKILEAINSRVDYTCGFEYTIGHKYLMNIDTLDDLRLVFKSKIIPLLIEIFNYNWEMADLALNSNGFIMHKKRNNNYILNIKNRVDEKDIYILSDIGEWSESSFQKIYTSNKDVSILRFNVIR